MLLFSVLSRVCQKTSKPITKQRDHQFAAMLRMIFRKRNLLSMPYVPTKDHTKKLPRILVYLARHLIRYLNNVNARDACRANHRSAQVQENDLSATIQNMEAKLFGLLLMEVRKIVYSYCKKYTFTNTSQKYEMAGRAWMTLMTGFRKRHSELLMRKP